MRLVILAASILLLAACDGRHQATGVDYPTDPRAKRHLHEATRARQTGNFALALEQIGLAERADSTAPAVLYEKGKTFLEMDRLAEARRAFEALVARYPRFEDGWMSLANVAMKQQQFEEAAVHYRREIALNASAMAWHNLGSALVQAGDHDAARDAYRRSREANPSYAPAYVGLADVEERAGRYDEALAYARRAVQLVPNDVRAREKAGFLLLRTGHLEDAEDELRRVLETAPWNYQARYNLGQVLQQQGRLEEAEEQLRRSESDREGQSELRRLSRVVARNPQDFRSHFALGIESQKWGRLDDALRSYRIARQLAPTNLRIDLNIATIHLHRGELDVAREMLESLVRKDSTLAIAWLNLGFTLARQGDAPGAHEAWERAMALEPSLRPAVAAFQARRNEG